MAMITALEPDRVFAIQMNDGTLAPAIDDYKIDCLANRVPPGDGEFDCVGFIRTLYDMGVDAPISLEVCSTELWQAPADVAARAAADGHARRAAGERAGSVMVSSTLNRGLEVGRLVLGGSVFVGRHLVDALVRAWCRRRRAQPGPDAERAARRRRAPRRRSDRCRADARGARRP